MAQLWCQACRNHERSITGIKKFSWIVGSTNQKTSNLVDHAKSEQHRAAMSRMQGESAKASKLPVTSYSPIALSLLTIDEGMQERLRKKFDICYVVAKQGLSFRKYPSIHALQERHDVNLCFSYKTVDSFRQQVTL